MVLFRAVGSEDKPTYATDNDGGIAACLASWFIFDSSVPWIHCAQANCAELSDAFFWEKQITTHAVVSLLGPCSQHELLDRFVFVKAVWVLVKVVISRRMSLRNANMFLCEHHRRAPRNMRREERTTYYVA